MTRFDTLISNVERRTVQLQDLGFASGRPSQPTQLWTSTGMLTSAFWGQSRGGKALAPLRWLSTNFPLVTCHHLPLDLGPTLYFEVC